MNKDMIKESMKIQYQRLGILFLSCLGSLGVLMLRMYKDCSLTYAFLVWNTLLAWAPLLISTSILTMQEQGRRRWQGWLLMPFWLLFLPNAPYILTDFLHFRPRHGIPSWYDAVMLVWFSWNGLLAGFFSLKQIEHFLSCSMQPKLAKAFTSGSIVLCSFGVYLGRFQRWNSWDALSRPGELFGTLMDDLMSRPTLHTRAMAVTTLLSVFLLLGYRMLGQKRILNED